MINQEIITEVQNRLHSLEEEEKVKILYACESGSRAWGFPSEDSDFDIRFIYIRKPEWYLSIDEGRDVIDFKIVDDIDLSGWDLRKTLKLYRKSNPPLLEWLGSPIVYLEQYSVTQTLRDLLPVFYSPISNMYHYLHMAEGNLKEHLKGEEVWTKKYFYVLRPLLACIWIEKDLGPVPTEFLVMVEKLINESSLKTAILNLVKDKKSGKELSWGKRIPEISDFIEGKVSYFQNLEKKLNKGKPDTEKLNEIFQSALIEVWNIKI